MSQLGEKSESEMTGLILTQEASQMELEGGNTSYVRIV
jgi:hypothetical protein